MCIVAEAYERCEAAHKLLIVVNSKCSDQKVFGLVERRILHVRQNYEDYSWGWGQITEVTSYCSCFQLLLCTREQECMKTSCILAEDYRWGGRGWV